MAPKSLSVKAENQTLKQATLSFASSKRTKSSNSVTKAKQPSQTKKYCAPISRRSSTSSSDDVSLEDVELTSAEEEGRAEPEERKQEDQAPPRRTLRPHISSDRKQSNKPAITVLQEKDSQEKLQTEKVARPELSDKDPRWSKHYSVVREEMGHQHPSNSICLNLVFG